MDLGITGIGESEQSSRDDQYDDDGESYSAAQVLEKLERAWMNEKMSPDLLEHHIEFVDVMLEQLKELEVMIEQTSLKADIRVSVHLMEMDRIRYVISDYLRCRLHKIEKFAQLIVSEPLEQMKLTEAELTFVRGYWSSIESHLKESAGKNMPENVRQVNVDKMVVKPDYHSYVFIKADKAVTGVTVTEPGTAEEEIVDFDTHDQQLLPYKCIENFLSDASVHLI